LLTHLGRPPNKPPNEHFGKPFIGLASGHSSGIQGGPLNRAPNKPPSGPPMGPYLGPKGYLIAIPFQWAHGRDIFGDHLWRPCVLIWYPTPIGPALSAYITRKSLPYLIYTIGTNPNTHV
jgi:hypothetical protein